MVAVEDFLAFANPELVESFEEAEQSFNLDGSCMGSSRLGAESEDESDSDGKVMGTEARTEDLTEDGIVEAFFSETCGCSHGVDKGPCSQVLPRKHAVEYRHQCLELSAAELDIAILGQLAALRRREPTIPMVSDPTREKKRRVSPRAYTVF